MKNLSTHFIPVIVLALAVSLGRAPILAQTFTRITTGAIVEDGGNSQGNCWGDFDKDGDLDLFVANFGENNFLYQNNGDGTFVRITTGAVVNDGGDSFGSSWGDFDNDGDLDLFVANDGDNFLYQNNGDSSFTRTTGEVVNDGGDSRGGSWGDFDNDGDLDLFVANVGDNFLYQNNGGSFTRITTGAIVKDGGNSFGSSWGDYDNDNDLDLFVANFFGENNFLYENNGDGSFTGITTGAAVNDGGDSWGGSWGDFDKDGDLDLFVANFGENNFLYQNNGDGSFTRVTTGAIVKDGGFSEGSSWADFDNDGDLDLFVANFGENNFLYQNIGNGSFTGISTGSIVKDGGFSLGSSWGDFDNDGDLDLFVANVGNNFLYQNNDSTHNWITIKCVGTFSNHSAIGTKVLVKATILDSSVWQLQEISGQTGHSGQNSLEAEFGLHNATKVDSVKILWPSGTMQVLTDIQQDTFLTITEIQPLVAEHVPLSIAETGQNVLLTTTVTGDIISEVRVYFRQGGDSQLLSVLMSNAAGSNLFEGSIPAERVASRGLEYHIVAKDIHGNNARLPAEGNYSVRVHISGDGISGNPQPASNGQTGYRLYSIPLDLDDKKPASVLEDDLGDYDDSKWRFLEYRNDGTYRDFPLCGDIIPGKAFWLIVQEAGKIIDSGAGTSNPTSQEYAIVLNPGWNLIGNPFNFSIPVGNNIRLASGGSFDLRSFEGDWNDPFSSPVDSIVPFDGYAVLNNSLSPDAMFINPDLSNAPGLLAKAKENLKNELSSKWLIHIRAQCQQARDSDNIAAVASRSSNAWDRLDLPEPPVIGDYVSVYFSHPEWQRLSKRFCTDFRPEFSDGEVWEFEVETNIRDEVKLTFEGIESVPDHFGVWLVDDVLNITQDLRKLKRYSVAGTSKKHPKQLKLVVGKDEFIQQQIASAQIIPIDFELSQNFPNPFNPATTIRYGLPKVERVTLKIYNILGEEVVALLNDTMKEAGYHAAIWDGRNREGRQVATGVYIYQIRAGDFLMSRKMALVR